ncbi:ArsR family transcriptional regulator [Candidatus Woesearchaeota archaeon]|nr:ArsR family transcriptional regulator [Candidatus Woesearchaeota archaeon]
MVFLHQRITIYRLRKPATPGINDELQWLGTSLGLFGLRDKDRSCFRLFITLLKAGKKNQSLTSDELADQLDLSRGTVVHHLNKLMEAGLVLHERNNYMLRVSKVSDLVDEIKQDMERTLQDIKKVADDIDKGLDL